jgi:hypothetical protein
MLRSLFIFPLLLAFGVTQQPANSNSDDSKYPSNEEVLLALDIVDKAFASYDAVLNGYKDQSGKNIVEKFEGKQSFDKDADAVKTGRELIRLLKNNPNKIRSYSLVGILTLADDVTLDASTTVTSASLNICKNGSDTASVTVVTAMTSDMRTLRDASEELMHVTMRYIAADEKLMIRMYNVIESNEQKTAAPPLQPAPEAAAPSHPATRNKVSTGCDPPIETHINGEFDGWEDEKKIYKMDNGQIWQQSNYHYHYHYAYHPSVLIYQTSYGNCHIKVEGDEDEGADVIKLR